MNRRLKSALILAAIIGTAYAISGDAGPDNAIAAKAETYRLVHAIGNSEKIVAKDLSKRECEARKSEHKIIVASLGVGGSVTCLRESDF